MKAGPGMSSSEPSRKSPVAESKLSDKRKVHRSLRHDIRAVSGLTRHEKSSVITGTVRAPVAANSGMSSTGTPM